MCAHENPGQSYNNSTWPVDRMMLFEVHSSKQVDRTSHELNAAVKTQVSHALACALLCVQALHCLSKQCLCPSWVTECQIQGHKSG